MFVKTIKIKKKTNKTKKKYHQKWAFHEVCLYKYGIENYTCASSTALSPGWYKLRFSLFSVKWEIPLNRGVRLIEVGFRRKYKTLISGPD